MVHMVNEQVVFTAVWILDSSKSSFAFLFVREKEFHSKKRFEIFLKLYSNLCKVVHGTLKLC